MLDEVDALIEPANLNAIPEPALNRKPSSPAPVAITLIAPLALEACGDGGSPSSPTTPTPPPPPPVPAVTSVEASRFLGQSSMGSAKADITRMASLTYDAWITEQFAIARPTSFYDWLVAKGYNAAVNINSLNGFDPAVWSQLITGPDLLRQRMGVALLDMLVVGIDGLTGNWRAFSEAAYLDILWDNAFGNYRQILGQISTNVAMGLYLTFLGNVKANTTTGAVPDENYARELMQLFTIGLYELNADGTRKTSGGQPIETYTQADISGLARVFTGWTYDSTDSTVPDRVRRPMAINAAQHEAGVKTFLGVTIPAGTAGPASMTLALDAIFAHANVPPFVSQQLIQRLVTSNPSPAYVGRVSAVFANNGSGVRGDMKAVIRAILTDAEARSAANLTSTTFGKLREPVIRLVGWARAFGVTSPTDLWPFGNTSSTANRIGQSVGHAPSVFNFFRPGYAPPGSAISAAGLVAPEFQITNEPSVVAYINYMQTLIVSGAGEAKADYTAMIALSDNSQTLLDEINLILAGGQVSAATIAQMKTALDTIAVTTTAGKTNRVYAAILLIMACPEFLTLK